MKLLFIFLVFFLVGYRTFDPDLGWHLRMGEIITTIGVPATDQFSYTMPSYPFVDYEWLTNVIWYRTFNFLGIGGWIVLYAIAVVLIMKILLPGTMNIYWWIVSFLIWSTLVNRFGMRAQVINWVFWAILTRTLYDIKFWEKNRKYYPALMFFWANLHGSYVFGVLITGIWVFLRCVQNKSIQTKNIIIWISGTLLTLVNPYGIRNWQEVVMQMQQIGYYRKTVAEWGPFYNLIEVGFWIAVMLVMFFGWKFKKMLSLPIWVILSLCLWSALSSHRFVPIFMIFAGPIIYENLKNLKSLVLNSKESLHRLNIFNRGILGMAMLIFLFTSVKAYVAGKSIREENFYPQKATSFLKNYDLQGRIFAPYDWAGYLIWKMPDQKVFVDGRMPGFRRAKREGESEQAFAEYLEVVVDENKWARTVKKFGIKTVLWFNTDFEDDDEVKMEVYEKFLERFEKDGWKRVYEDEVAVIYTKQAEQ